MAAGPRRPASARHASRGFTYLGVMFVVVVLSMTAVMAAVLWSLVKQREDERELVFIGRQFEAAIERYQQRSQGPGPRYPQRLEELLRDERVPGVRRDLRRLYVDPFTGVPQWGLVRLPDGGIVGVHSLSGRVSLQRRQLSPGVPAPQGRRYVDWRFIAPSAHELLESATSQ